MTDPETWSFAFSSGQYCGRLKSFSNVRKRTFVASTPQISGGLSRNSLMRKITWRFNSLVLKNRFSGRNLNLLPTTHLSVLQFKNSQTWNLDCIAIKFKMVDVGHQHSTSVKMLINAELQSSVFFILPFSPLFSSSFPSSLFSPFFDRRKASNKKNSWRKSVTNY